MVPWNQPREVERLRSQPGIAAAGERLELIEADLFDEGAVAEVVSGAESPRRRSARW